MAIITTNGSPEKKKIQKYLSKKSLWTTFKIQFERCSKVRQSWGKVYKIFGIGEMTQSNAKGNFQKNFLRKKEEEERRRK